jgi:uncharacterized protein YkwD
MVRYPSACALLFLVCTVGCLDTDLGGTGSASCGPNGSCQSSDCYARCYCETQDTGTCERQCGARGVRVQDLDESAWTTEWAAFEDEVVRLTNDARAEGGCCASRCFPSTPPLMADPLLTRASRAHAFDMIERGYFAHDAPDGRSPFDRMREAGFRGCALGENIAAGQRTPAEVFMSWRDSPGHCANMLSPSFDSIGVGYRPAPGQRLGHFWVQNFGAAP